MNKEIRVLNFDTLLNTAAMIKKERDENYRGEIPEENEYRTSKFIQLMPLLPWEERQISRVTSAKAH
jgi:hypothetical protein